MKKILAINGSYREGGVTDQYLDLFTQGCAQHKAEITVIQLRKYPIEFCTNCRACCQEPGELPGKCTIQDDMASLIDTIEQADGYILASPTNFFTVTALYKRFLERLLPYAYWPWGANAPIMRKKKNANKRAIVLSSCAAPGIMGRVIYGTHRQLKLTAQTIGAKPVGTLFTGLISKQANPRLPEKTNGQVW